MHGLQMADESSKDKFTGVFIQISNFFVDEYVHSIFISETKFINNCTVCMFQMLIRHAI